LQLGNVTEVAVRQLENIEDEGLQEGWGKIAEKRITSIKQKQKESEDIKPSPLENDSD